MANPIPWRSGQRSRGQRKRREPMQIVFKANVRLDPSMVTDLRTSRGSSSQLQARRAIRSSRGTRR